MIYSLMVFRNLEQSVVDNQHQYRCKREVVTSLFRKLGEHFPPIIFLLALLSAFPPLATDMYLPALPLLQHQWQVPLVTINFTLVIFFLTYCAFILVYGPLSDRYGRKPPLLVGVGVFVVACLFCAMAQSPGMLIGGRFAQGAGAAAASAIVFAICKDRFTGQQRQRIFIQIGVIVAAAPMIAPVLGGWILALWSWRWIFLLQAVLGTLAFIGVVRMRESLQSEIMPSFSEVAGSYFRLFGNSRYILLLATFSCTCVPIFSFIGGSPDLYITRLGFTEQQFSYFFGFNALAFILAPLSLSRLVPYVPVTRIMPGAFIGMLIASLFLLCPLLSLPWRLTLPMFCLTFCFSFCRPAGNNLILEQVQQDTGAASSFMVFCYFMIGALSMWFFSFDWLDKILVLAVMGIGSSSFTLLMWQVARKRLLLPAGEQARADG
ncbi:MAG: multidrug effflux MFS transporter [Desulfobulbus oligotrophicus]|jgi:DHA1 family bicyclomycin/chloramphenicol resistance-like MFS transporter|nr:multidrug effflux MFS transporter [Desulfobulbus oligotrophicus]